MVMSMAGLICLVKLKVSVSGLLYKGELGALTYTRNDSIRLFGKLTIASVVMKPIEDPVSRGISFLIWILSKSSPTAKPKASGRIWKIWAAALEFATTNG